MNPRPSAEIPTPLAINIFWDGEADRNTDQVYQTYVKHLYTFFNRAVGNPLNINLNIPVYLYPIAPSCIETLGVSQNQHNINIVFADYTLLDAPEWKTFLDLAIPFFRADKEGSMFVVDLFEEGDSVARHFRGYRSFKGIAGKGEGAIQELIISLTHSICRHIKVYSLRDELTDGPVRIFISHAWHDGRPFAEGLKKRIDEIAELNSFLDTKNITYGGRFDEEIRRSIKKSVLLVLQTDHFSTREWCRREVLIAKELGRPVVVINQMVKGENRAFPYLGNVPHVRFSEKLSSLQGTEAARQLYDSVLLSMLGETLRFQLSELTINLLSKAFLVEPDHRLNYAPELATLPRWTAQEEAVIVYPDPPVGLVEKELLKQIRPKLTFVTPMFLPLLSNDGQQYQDLSTLTVGLSLSETAFQPFSWIKNDLIVDLIVDITRYLMVSGVTISFGGTLEYNDENGEQKKYNVSTLLVEMVSTYRRQYENSVVDEIKPISCFTAYPAAVRITKKEKKDLYSVAKFTPILPPDYLELNEAQMLALGNYGEGESEEDQFVNKYTWWTCFKEMRHKMITAEDVRICLGGKWIGFISRMPGTLEEALIALKNDHPVYIIGGFGGVAAGLAKALEGGKPPQLDFEFYQEFYPEYANFLEAYNAHELTVDREEQVDYQEILQFLQKKGSSDDSFGLNNGLSRKENQLLFYSTSPLEIMCLLLKGMRNKQHKKSGHDTP